MIASISVKQQQLDDLRTYLRMILDTAESHPVFDKELFNNRDAEALTNCRDSDTAFSVSIAINAHEALEILKSIAENNNAR